MIAGKRIYEKVTGILFICCLFLLLNGKWSYAEMIHLTGVNRSDTAIKVAQQSWNGNWSNEKTVVLVSGKDENIVDALAAVPFAFSEKAPILFNTGDKDSLDLMTLLAMKDNGVEKVFIASGTAVISEKIEEQLKAIGIEELERLGGENRYDTAKKIAERMGNPSNVMVVNGEIGLADALSIAPIAAARKMSILFSDGQAMPFAYDSAKSTYVLGGKGVIADSVVRKLGATRIAGDSRYDTNAKILEMFKMDLNFDKVYAASGKDGNLADALAVSVLAAQSKSPIILVGTQLEKGQKTVIQENLSANSQVEIVGGGVSSRVESEILDVFPKSDEQKMAQLDGITTSGLTKILIHFKTPIINTKQKLEVEKNSNYSIESLPVDMIKEAKLKEDQQTVELLLKDEFNKKDQFVIENGKRYLLKIEDLITGKEEAKEIYFNETEFPKVESLDVIGWDTIKVSFNQSIRPDFEYENSDLNPDTFLVNNGDVDVKSIQLTNNNKEAVLTLYSDLEEGQKVEVGINKVIRNYANYPINKQNLTAVVRSSSEPLKIIGYSEIKEGQIVLKFNKDVKFVQDNPDKSKFYHTNKNNTVSSLEQNLEAGNKITLHFDYEKRLPNGTTYIYIERGMIEDLWENKNSKLSTKVELQEDDSKPTVEKIEQGKGESILISFSKPIDKNTGENRNNYAIEDKEGKAIRIQKAEILSEDKVKLTFYDNLPQAKYRITISRIEDLVGNVIEDKEYVFSMLDKTSFDWQTLSARLYKAGSSTQKIIIGWNGREMQVGKAADSIQNLNKYILKFEKDGVEYTKSVADLYKSSIQITENNSITEILLPYRTGGQDSYNLGDVSNLRVVVGRVSDASGNMTEGISSPEIQVKSNVEVGIKNDILAVETGQIQITYEEEVDFHSEDISVVAKNAEGKFIPLAIDKIFKSVNEQGKTVVKIFLNKNKNELSYDATSDGREVYIFTKEHSASQNKYGGSLKAGYVRVMDGIAPAVEKIQQNENRVNHISATLVNNNTAIIKAVFGEKLDKQSISNTSFALEKYQIRQIVLDEDEKTVEIFVDGLDVEREKTIQEGFIIQQMGGIKDKSVDSAGNKKGNINLEQSNMNVEFVIDNRGPGAGGNHQDGEIGEPLIVGVDTSLIGTTIVEIKITPFDLSKYNVFIKGQPAKYYPQAGTFKTALSGYYEIKDIKKEDIKVEKKESVE